MNANLVTLLFAMLFAFALCQNESNTIKLHVSGGSTKWWLAVDIKNEVINTTSVEVRESLSLRWVPAVFDSTRGYFQLTSSASRGFQLPLSFRLTATNGNRVVASNIMRTIEADSLVDTSVQYSTVVPTQAPTRAPTPAPTQKVTATSSPTRAPAATSAPTQKATATSSPAQAPATPATPAATSAPTQKATATSSPTQAPATPATPAATSAPTQKATVTSSPTQAPASTTAPTTAPATQAPTQPAVATPSAKQAVPSTLAPTVQAATPAPTQKAATSAPTQTSGTVAPTKAPTATPIATQTPTAVPTKAPTFAPVATPAPTKAATQLPGDLCTVTTPKAEALQIMVPLYVYPGAAWDQLIQVASTGVKIIAIINPNSGPLAAGPDAAYTTYMKKLQDANIDMVGYVHTLWGARDEPTVQNEINLWATKYTGIKGIFFDEGATEASAIPYYTRAYNLVQAKGWIHTILNPGAQPDQGYLAISSNIVIFENYATSLGSMNFASWVGCAPNAAAKAGYKYKFTSMVHTAALADMPWLIQESHRKGMGVVYVTDGEGGCCTYNSLSTYFVNEGSSVKSYNLA